MLTSIPMNPYESQLANKDPLQIVASTPVRLTSLLDQIGAEAVQSAPAPGKWSVREIVCHLADCEIAFAFRLRQTLAEPRHVIQPFDQEKWAATYAGYNAPAALALFKSLREWNRLLIASLSPEARSTRVTHPERGDMTFQVLVETMAGHDINHLRQLEAIAGRAGLSQPAAS